LAKILSKQSMKWILPVVGVLVVALLGYRWWQSRQSRLPAGIISGNGRLEATLVDMAAREALRVNEVLVNEGDSVKPGQVLVKLDTTTLEADFAGANAGIAAAQERVAFAEGSIVRQKSEIELAQVEAARSKNLVRQGAGSQRDLDVANTKVQTTQAALAESEAGLASAKEKVEQARAEARAIQTRIDDATIKSPVTGRVLYRLAEPGEMLAAGGKALTLVNLEDIYMEIFVPSEQAAKMKIGSEARVTVDYEPVKSIAGYVSFVSPEAQFTPKQVETKTEREKLMFRVKIQLPRELGLQYIERIKTGIRGVGYVKVDPNAVWPERLTHTINPAPEARR
jgi:HlyD family secretion protein